jgi:hypothetical protein
MDRTYLTINEAGAKTAHGMMHFSDYIENSATDDYRKSVDAAYDLADKVAGKRPEQAERVYSMAERYSKRMAQYTNKEISIGLMCPSVMISGAGNFPVHKKEKQVNAWERNRSFYEETQGILKKMENILYAKETIKSGDADAIERLEEKLKDLQEEMKAANRAVRMKDTELGDAKLVEIGYSQEQIHNLRQPDYIGRIGYPDFELKNNNQNIHAVENRLKRLKAAKERGPQERQCEFYRVVENAEIMRLQIFFDEKPEPEVREVLKKNGFKWAPSQSAWQRQLTSNARWALHSVELELKKLKGVQDETDD